MSRQDKLVSIMLFICLCPTVTTLAADLKVEGNWKPHKVLQLDPYQKNGIHKYPALFQNVTENWDQQDSGVPSLTYMPEKKRLAMLVNTPGSRVTFSDNQGATWSDPRSPCQEIESYSGFGLVYLP